VAWYSGIRLETPCWEDYRAYVTRMGDAGFPDCARLNALLGPDAVNGAGQPVRFVPSGTLDDTPYEQQVWKSGLIATRPGSWHDLFNALVWVRFPRIKSAMNALHHQEIAASGDARRGPVRDALTLFDECGAIVFSADAQLLGKLAQRSWHDVFVRDSARWESATGLCVCGHAMLEKCLSPYKSMTANALLVRLRGGQMKLERERLLRLLDERLAAAVLGGGLLRHPSRLSPLPLAGVPGWWRGGAQDGPFYADKRVFRPAPEGFEAPPVYSLL